jgi:predicted ArsR family transcriptional regulator
VTLTSGPERGGEIPKDEIRTLPEHVPVTMPQLPPRLTIASVEQFKAIAEPTRTRILGIIQNHPATAKQIADRLKIAPGAAGHHLQVLEAAGLAQVVAKRLVRGIVAKFYARTARIFVYDLPPEVTGERSPTVDIMTTAANELTETLAESKTESKVESRTEMEASANEREGRGLHTSFPHGRMSPERAMEYAERLSAIVEDLIAEPYDPDGEVYGMIVALFRSPDYMQSAPQAPRNQGQQDRRQPHPHDAAETQQGGHE